MVNKKRTFINKIPFNIMEKLISMANGHIKTYPYNGN